MLEIEKKVPIHLGLYGHIDSGKTAIASVLSEIKLQELMHIHRVKKGG